MTLRRCFTPLLALQVLAPILVFAQTETATPSSPPPPAEPSAASPVTAPTPVQQASPAVQPATQGPSLTLEECVARALDKNFDLRIQRFSTDNAKESLTIAKAAFDPALQLKSNRTYSRSATVTPVLDAEGNIINGLHSTQSGDSTSVAISQELTTGTGVTLSQVLDRSKSNPVRVLPNPSFDSDVLLQVRQPILRGAGTRVARAEMERAKLGVAIANLDFRGSVLAVVRNVETSYYNVAFAREQMLVRRFSLDVKQRLLEENRARRQTGAATDLEVLQAEVGVANARRDLLLAEQQVHDREDALLSLIQPFGFSSPIGDLRLNDEPVATISAERSFQLARENTPEYASTRNLIQQYRIDLDVAKSNRLPTLDVGGSLGYAAHEDNYGSAATRAWGGPGYNWGLDLTLTVPWGLRADRARYRQSKNTLDREQLHLQQIEQDLLLQVRSAVRAVETNQETVRISRLATELSERQFELEKARYDAGLSTFRRVQEAQADLDNARVDELQAKVTLRNALADLAKIEGSSLQKYRIKLQE